MYSVDWIDNKEMIWKRLHWGLWFYEFYVLFAREQVANICSLPSTTNWWIILFCFNIPSQVNENENDKFCVLITSTQMWNFPQCSCNFHKQQNKEISFLGGKENRDINPCILLHLFSKMWMVMCACGKSNWGTRAKLG